MKYFILEELVDKKTFETHGDKAWDFFSEKTLTMLDDLRSFFGVPITCNNWHLGGEYQYRGYVPDDTPGGIDETMPHKINVGFDLDVKGYTASEARKKVLLNQDNPLLKNINRVEGLVPYLHIDTLEPPPGEKRIYLYFTHNSYGVNNNG